MKKFRTMVISVIGNMEIYFVIHCLYYIGIKQIILGQATENVLHMGSVNALCFGIATFIYYGIKTIIGRIKYGKNP